MSSKPPASASQGIVIFAKNRQRVSLFYQRALDLSVVFSDASCDVLAGPGQEVVVHSMPKPLAVLVRIPRPLLPREETPMKPAFVVPSLSAVRQAIKRTGGHLQPVERAWQWSWPGRCFTVLDGWDPEGNVVQFRQVELHAAATQRFGEN